MKMTSLTQDTDAELQYLGLESQNYQLYGLLTDEQLHDDIGVQ